MEKEKESLTKELTTSKEEVKSIRDLVKSAKEIKNNYIKTDLERKKDKLLIEKLELDIQGEKKTYELKIKRYLEEITMQRVSFTLNF